MLLLLLLFGLLYTGYFSLKIYARFQLSSGTDPKEYLNTGAASSVSKTNTRTKRDAKEERAALVRQSSGRRTDLGELCADEHEAD